MARKYSEGYVIKSGNYWKAIISYQENGKQKRVTKSTGIRCYPDSDNRNKTKAVAFLREWREQLMEEEARRNPEGGDMPFYDYCDRFLRLHHVKPVTKAGYKTHMKKILNTDLGNKKIAEVTGDDIRRWENDRREDGLSETTIVHEHAFISMILGYAFAEGTITRNPILAVHGPKRPWGPVNSLTPEGRAAVLKKMDKCENYQLSTSVRLALLAGMRRGEVCAIRWQDVDLDNRMLHIVHSLTKDHGFKLDSPKDPKGGKVLRDVPIGNVLTKYLREQKARQKDEVAELGTAWSDATFVVGDPIKGSFFNPEMLGRQWSMLSDAECWKGTQGEKVTFHDLRHTFATLAISQGVMDIMSLSKIMGHRDSAMTLNKYADALSEAKRMGMDALDDSLGYEDKKQPHGRHFKKPS